jgi:ADP-heptose:LPS heptosyltransferase
MSANISAQSPVIFDVNGYGDRLMSLPTIRALSQKFGSNLSLICASGDRELFYTGIPFENVYETEFITRDGERQFDAVNLAQQLDNCDLLISLNPWHSSSMDCLLTLLSQTSSIGFYPTFTHILPIDEPEHYINRAFRVAKCIDPNLDLAHFNTAPIFPSHKLSRAEAMRQTIPHDNRVLAIHTETLSQKMWSISGWTTVLNAFLDRYPEYIIFILDREYQGVYLPSYRDRVIHFSGLSLSFIFALIGTVDLFLGIDSCLLHAADLYRIPSVGLFAATDPRQFGFRFTQHHHITTDGNMADLDPEVVLAALMDLAEKLADL